VRFDKQGTSLGYDHGRQLFLSHFRQLANDADVFLLQSVLLFSMWWRGVAVTLLAYQRSCSTSGPVSTGMGDRLRRTYHLSIRQATQANSASYLQRDGKWVPAKVRWCSAAGE